MDIAVGKDPIGTLVIEVFDDIAPNAAREFVLRVSDDAGAGRAGDVKYANTEIHMIADGVNVDGGRAPGMKPLTTGGGGVPIEEANDADALRGGGRLAEARLVRSTRSRCITATTSTERGKSSAGSLRDSIT